MPRDYSLYAKHCFNLHSSTSVLSSFEIRSTICVLMEIEQDKNEVRQEVRIVGSLNDGRTKLTAGSFLTLTLYQERHSQSVSHTAPAR